MSMKDWKRNFTYGKITNGEKSITDSWKKKVGNEEALVDVRDYGRENLVNVSIYPIKGHSIERNFKKRVQALKFARSYMRKH